MIAFLLWQRRRRRLAEASLRDSEQRMTLAVDAAKFGIWIRDLARNEIWASDQWRALFGFGKTERLELPRILEKVYPEDREPLRQTLESALERGGDYETEYRIVLPDGRLRWIASQGRADRNGGGNPVLVRGVSRDITARKLAEEEANQHRNEVAHLARVTTLGEISGSLAHELNQPLGAILANAEAAELHLQRQTPKLDEVRAILKDIRADDLRASEIIHGMRAFLQRRELEMQPLELGQIADEAVKLIRADAAARQTTVGIDIQPDLPRVTGDSIHLRQVLLNLLVNGMDAMSTCPVADRRITIRAMRLDPQNVEIAVRDAGVGISPRDRGRVFEPFHTTKRGGLGLGLAICRSIVEAHGGSISVANNSDRGATAKFTLRVAAEAA